MLKDFIFLILGVTLITVAAIQKKSEYENNPVFLVPPQDLKYFSLGYHEVMADSLWLRVIQDFDHCGRAKPPAESLKSSGEFDAPKERCVSGWVFRMLDSVTELAPKFKLAYLSGAIMLTAVVHDYSGASVIFEKGIAQFPNEWRLLYYASYHALYTENKFEKAADLLVQAAKNGAPPWTYALAAKLYTRVGRALFAKSVLLDIIDDQEERWVPTIKKRLEDIEVELSEAAKQENSDKQKAPQK